MLTKKSTENPTKTAKTVIAPAGMRREVLDKKSGLYVPTNASVKEAQKWVEYTQL